MVHVFFFFFLGFFFWVFFFSESLLFRLIKTLTKNFNILSNADADANANADADVTAIALPVLSLKSKPHALVQSVSRDFHENRSNCDKSVKFGTRLHYLIINQNRPGHK